MDEEKEKFKQVEINKVNIINKLKISNIINIYFKKVKKSKE